MTLSEIAIWYFSIIGAIFVVFERVEKYSNRSDLDLYYLVLTVKRNISSKQRHTAILKFFDMVFGRGRLVGRVQFPSFMRVFCITLAVHAIAWCILVIGFGLRAEKITIVAVAVSLIVCALLDYVVFAKSRIIMDFAMRQKRLILSSLTMLADIIIVIFLCIVAEFIYGVLIFTMTEFAPSFVERISQTQIEIYPIRLSWGSYQISTSVVGGNVAIMMLVNLCSALASTFILVIFQLSLILSKIKSKISLLQDFIDNHTSAEERPLQILGLFSIISFTPIFWFSYLIYRYLM